MDHNIFRIQCTRGIIVRWTCMTGTAEIEVTFDVNRGRLRRLRRLPPAAGNAIRAHYHFMACVGMNISL